MPARETDKSTGKQQLWTQALVSGMWFEQGYVSYWALSWDVLLISIHEASEASID